MILAIDIGNTNICLGGYSGDSLKFTARIATDLALEADQYAVEMRGILHLHNVTRSEIQGVMIASVVPPLTKTLLRALAHFTSVQPLLLSLEDAGGMAVDIDNPAELGMDLLAGALYAHRHFPLPAVVVDLGTTTKLIALDTNGALQGVSIAPGLFVSLRAMLQNTSLLSSISLEAPPHAIGRNTPDSMKSGLVLGTAAMVDGLLDLFAQELEGIQSIIATGGASGIIAPCCRHTLTHRPDLVLDSLYEAYLARTGKDPKTALAKE